MQAGCERCKEATGHAHLTDLASQKPERNLTLSCNNVVTTA
jgi:hypothetical protein